MSYIGKTPTAVPLTSSDLADGIVSTDKLAANAVTTAKITDGTIAEADIANDAVTADKIANAVNSAISANTSKTTNATHSGEVTGSGALTIADNVVDEANLKVSNSAVNGYMLSAQSGNTGGLTWVEAGGGDYVKLYHSDISGAASYTFNLFNSSIYANYKVYIDKFTTGSNGSQLKMRFRNSSGDVTNSDYEWQYLQNYFDGSNSSVSALTSMNGEFVPINNGLTSTNNVGTAILEITGIVPVSTVSRPTVHWTSLGWGDTTSIRRFYTAACQLNRTVANCSGFTLYSDQNFVGNVSIYGVKK